MHITDDHLVLSATDLAGFSACRQRSLLDRLRAMRRIDPPHLVTDKRLDLLRERGMEHERTILRRFEQSGSRVVAFDSLPKEERNVAGYKARADATLEAMRSGADVIYQGTVFDTRWLGFVDFLLRVERPSDLGDWSYEVADAKLAREAKATAVLQTCVYSEMLAGVQGVRPERIHIYLGGPDGRKASFRLDHFAAYTRSLRARLDAHLADATDTAAVAPEPVDLCQVCDWRPRCRAERVEVDHLSLVAGITKDQRRVLRQQGADTLAALARLPLDPPPEGLKAASFQRIREQARVQLTGRERGEPYHELLPLEPNPGGSPLGLAALPKPDPQDWFFDFEGADYAYDEGLEYLWGISDNRDGYRGVWALDPEAEKAALLEFLAEAEAHVEAHPGAHIYHFGHYEPTALKRLVGRYGVGTDALDRLLKQGVFVDLHRIVKQGLRASVESYSIKELEAHYGFERAVPMKEANPARGRLEYALATGLRDEEALADRPVVEAYNRDDCVSTRALRSWLEELRAELEAQEGEVIPRPEPPEPEEEAEDEESTEVAQLMERLLAGVPEEREARTPQQHVRWLAAHLLEWHRREDKTAWWDFFRLRDLSVHELVEENKPLSGLEYEGPVGTEKQSILHRFRFPPQEHRFKPGDAGIDPHFEPAEPPEDGKRKKMASRTIWAIDDLGCTVDLKVGKRTEFDPEKLRALLPDEVVTTKTQRAQLRQTAERLLDGEQALEDWSPASLALLRRDLPAFRTSGKEEAVKLPAVARGARLVDRAVEASLRLQEGVFPVQGPPGTGKTYSGARMIRALLRAGLSVGVTGPSHKVITNLLNAVCEADKEDAPTDIVGVQVKKKEEEACVDGRFTLIASSSDLGKAEQRREDDGEPAFNLYAGTAWLWSRDVMEQAVDVLFIDEAGQFSLANALAVAPAAPKLVLLGDPQQLNQPQKGIHPPGTEVSVLEHLAGEDGIIEPEQGLFLGETWRMRPEITAYTSELFYEDKLVSRADLTNQRLGLPDGSTLEGVLLEDVTHEGNSRESVEEADRVVEIFDRLLVDGATFTDRHGETRALKLDDVLVVAPYNAQVDRIRATLAGRGYEDARVGTVDKFQGQEAAVAVYSLASSSAEDAPRGMDFLYALDRLNVATSRARVCTIVVASPKLLVAECKRPRQMRLVNAVVRYAELAEPVATG